MSSAQVVRPGIQPIDMPFIKYLSFCLFLSTRSEEEDDQPSVHCHLRWWRGVNRPWNTDRVTLSKTFSFFFSKTHREKDQASQWKKRERETVCVSDQIVTSYTLLKKETAAFGCCGAVITKRSGVREIVMVFCISVVGIESKREAIRESTVQKETRKKPMKKEKKWKKTTTTRKKTLLYTRCCFVFLCVRAVEDREWPWAMRPSFLPLLKSSSQSARWERERPRQL